MYLKNSGEQGDFLKGTGEQAEIQKGKGNMYSPPLNDPQYCITANSQSKPDYEPFSAEQKLEKMKHRK